MVGHSESEHFSRRPPVPSAPRLPRPPPRPPRPPPHRPPRPPPRPPPRLPGGDRGEGERLVQAMVRHREQETATMVVIVVHRASVAVMARGFSLLALPTMPQAAISTR
eukprot:879673-Pyramimonas_sp.AAC.1